MKFDTPCFSQGVRMESWRILVDKQIFESSPISRGVAWWAGRLG